MAILHLHQQFLYFQCKWSIFATFSLVCWQIFQISYILQKLCYLTISMAVFYSVKLATINSSNFKAFSLCLICWTGSTMNIIHFYIYMHVTKSCIIWPEVTLNAWMLDFASSYSYKSKGITLCLLDSVMIFSSSFFVGGESDTLICMHKAHGREELDWRKIDKVIPCSVCKQTVISCLNVRIIRWLLYQKLKLVGHG